MNSKAPVPLFHCDNALEFNLEIVGSSPGSVIFIQTSSRLTIQILLLLKKQINAVCTKKPRLKKIHSSSRQTRFVVSYTTAHGYYENMKGLLRWTVLSPIFIESIWRWLKCIEHFLVNRDKDINIQRYTYYFLHETNQLH